MQPLFSVIDHLVYAASDLPVTIESTEALSGIRAATGGYHKALADEKCAAFARARIYLEIMGPDETRHFSNQPRPFDLDTLTEPRLATWVARSLNIPAVLRTARIIGVDLGELLESNRQKPDGSILKWTMTDLTIDREGGVIPSFINWGTSAHPAQSSPAGCTLSVIKLIHPDAERIRHILLDLGLDVAADTGPKAGLEAVIATPKGLFKLV